MINNLGKLLSEGQIKFGMLQNDKENSVSGVTRNTGIQKLSHALIWLLDSYAFLL